MNSDGSLSIPFPLWLYVCFLVGSVSSLQMFVAGGYDEQVYFKEIPVEISVPKLYIRFKNICIILNEAVHVSVHCGADADHVFDKARDLGEELVYKKEKRNREVHVSFLLMKYGEEKPEFPQLLNALRISNEDYRTLTGPENQRLIDTVQFITVRRTQIHIYSVATNNEGSPDFTHEISTEKPYNPNLVDDYPCCILHDSDARLPKVFYWIRRERNEDEKRDCISARRTYLNRIGPIYEYFKEKENKETSMFKMYFHNWLNENFALEGIGPNPHINDLEAESMDDDDDDDDLASTVTSL